MLELKDASLTLGGKRLFSRLSMMALDGQMTCITGPADCGKTALVRVMLGFQPLDEGLVSINGALLTPLSAGTFRRMMTYIPQPHPPSSLPPLPDLTGMETAWGLPISPIEPMSPINPMSPMSPMSPISPISPMSPMSPISPISPIILADSPSPDLIPMLRQHVSEGRTVVVATRLRQYLDIADKIFDLGNNENK